MAKLPKFALTHNNEKYTWDLKNDATKRTLKSFDNKSDATKGGVLEKAVGPQGGSVKLRKLDGEYQEERTFPRSADPRSSKG
jgi:hypothetical protein